MMNRDGYALIAALWFLVLGSAISLEAAHAARKHRLQAAGLAEGAQARVAAAAGIEHARARLATLARLALPGAATDPTLVTDPWHAAPDALADTIALERSRYVVGIRDVNALVNVNRADDVQLRQLLLALRIDAHAANRIAQAVLDWRDDDDFHRVDGAERREYIEQRRTVLPRNAPFESVDEVQHVMGMTPALFARVRPYLTTEGSGRINFTTAAAPVLAAAPGMSDEAVAVVLRRRAARQPVRSPTAVAGAALGGGTADPGTRPPAVSFAGRIRDARSGGDEHRLARRQSGARPGDCGAGARRQCRDRDVEAERMTGLRRVRIGCAVGTNRVVAVLVRRRDATVPVVVDVAVSDAPLHERIAAAFAAAVAGALEPLSKRAAARAVIRVALLPSLAQVRRLTLPPMREAERTRVLSREASGYFFGAREAHLATGYALPARRSVPSQAIAAAAPAALLDALRAALPPTASVDAFVPAAAAWAAALPRAGGSASIRPRATSALRSRQRAAC